MFPKQTQTIFTSPRLPAVLRHRGLTHASARDAAPGPVPAAVRLGHGQDDFAAIAASDGDEPVGADREWQRTNAEVSVRLFTFMVRPCSVLPT